MDNCSNMFVSSVETQQKSEKKYPETLVIAINKNGVNLINPKTKVRVRW